MYTKIDCIKVSVYGIFVSNTDSIDLLPSEKYGGLYKILTQLPQKQWSWSCIYYMSIIQSGKYISSALNKIILGLSKCFHLTQLCTDMVRFSKICYLRILSFFQQYGGKFLKCFYCSLWKRKRNIINKSNTLFGLQFCIFCIHLHQACLDPTTP